MDWSEFLTNPDFKSYNRKLTHAIAEVLYATLTKENVHPEYLKGCLTVSKKVLNLPLNLSDDKDLNESINKDVKKNFAGITAHLMRE